MHRRFALTTVGALFLVIAAGGWLSLSYPGPGGQMTQKATAFLKSLSPEELNAATMPYGAASRTGWHFIPKPKRKGLQIGKMNQEQRQLAFELLRASLSEAGYEKARVIMNLEGILAVLEKDRKGGPVRDPRWYYVTIFGEPNPQGKWGFSFEGHHLSLNFVVAENKIVSHTPHFWGANPAVVKEDYGTSIKKGTRVLDDEEKLAFKLFNSLDDKQAKVALLQEKAFDEIRAAGEAQPPQTAPAGLAVSKMNEDQTKLLWSLIKTYANHMPKKLYQQEIEKIQEAGIEQVHFAWAGASKPGIGHYYRIQGPSFLIEFVNVQPDPAGNPANHIHAIWRDMSGDFYVRLETPHE